MIPQQDAHSQITPDQLRLAGEVSENLTDAEVVQAVIGCAKHWEAGVRLLGNIRACDISRALEALSESSGSEQPPPDRLMTAIRTVTKSLVGVQRIKVEADPLNGIQEHERWYPKASLVDTDALIELSDALKSGPSETQEERSDVMRLARQMFSDGVDVARTYGDNAFHLWGKELERQFQNAWKRVEAGEWNVRPSPSQPAETPDVVSLRDMLLDCLSCGTAHPQGPCPITAELPGVSPVNLMAALRKALDNAYGKPAESPEERKDATR
jgi:hypothetical protein